jgi:transcriptional regulator with XRE-family HTH domain
MKRKEKQGTEGERQLPGPSPAAFVAAMRAVRVDRGLSVTDAAAAAGVSPGHLADVEGGRREADFELIVAVADALHTTASEFVRRAGRLEADQGNPAAGERASGAPGPHDDVD